MKLNKATPVLALCLVVAGCGDTASRRDPGAEDAADADEGTAEPEAAADGDAPEAPDADILDAPDNDEGTPEPEAEADADVADAPDSDEYTPEPEAEADADEQEGERREAEEAGYPRCRPSDRPLALARDRGELQPLGWPRRSVESSIAAPCDVHAYRFAGAAGMQVRATLTPLGAGQFAPQLQVFDARAVLQRHAGLLPLIDENSAPGQPASATLTLEQSGEYLLLAAAADLTSTGAFAAEVQCLSNCERRFTRYPIVLLHGAGGFDSAFQLDYFFRVKDTLLAEGYSVHSLDVASMHGSEARAAMAAPIIEEILEQTGAAKVNLIGHSQGGLDTRYLISSLGFGDRVGVAVLYAVPNQGSVVADIILEYIPGFAMDVIAELVDAYGMLVGTGSDQDTKEAAEFLSVRYMQSEFNPNNPDDPRVTYWSWAGETCVRTDLACIASHNGEVVELTLAPTHRILNDGGSDENFGPNDGMVVVQSARWGDFRGVLFADHMDEVGQIADLNNPAFDHLQFFGDMARAMYLEGF